MEDKIEVKEGYYNNGQLKYKYQSLNDKYHGEQLSYWDTGQLSYKHQLFNGKYHGEQLSYYGNGRLYYRDFYINDRKVSEEEWLEHNKAQHNTQFLTDMYV